jgi:hypothetical protein
METFFIFLSYTSAVFRYTGDDGCWNHRDLRICSRTELVLMAHLMDSLSVT